MTISDFRVAAIAGVFASLVSTGTAQAQIVEGLPDYMLSLVHPEALSPVSLSEERQYGWLDSALLWERGRTLKVCFFGGPPQARSAIAAVASEWNSVGANLKLDFGDMSNPRICGVSNEASQIRVSFTQPGYWSLLAKQAELSVPMSMPSLNLQRFDFAPPEPGEFRRLVLHEFGHALGLQHEHQMPGNECEWEYNWDYVYSRLAGSPNFWPPSQVNFNIRPQPLIGEQVGTSFDIDSIMLYSFPREFYTQGEQSRCYSSRINNEISASDASALRLAYPFAGGDRRFQALATAGREARTTEESAAVFTYAMTPEEVADVHAARFRDEASAAAAVPGRLSYERALAAWREEMEERVRGQTAWMSPLRPQAPVAPTPSAVEVLQQGRAAAAERLGLGVRGPSVETD